MAIILEVVQGPSLSLTPTIITLESVGGVGPAGSDATVTATNIGAAIAGADALTTPLSTHGIAVEVSGVVKRTTWANIVATIQTALASVFQPKAAVLTNTTASFTTAQESKLSGIEAGAEVNNISDTDATDLTDGGETTLHSHAAGGIDYTNPMAITGAGTITPVDGAYYTLDFKLATFTGTAGEVFKPSAFTLTSFTIWGKGAGTTVPVNINTSDLAIGEIFCLEMQDGESRILRLDAAGDLIKADGIELLATASISDNNTSLLSIPENSDTVMPMTTSYNDPTGSMVDTSGNGSIVLFRPALVDCYAKIVWSASSTTSNHNTQTRLYVNGGLNGNNTGVMLSGSSNLANTHQVFLTRVTLAKNDICTPRVRHSDLVGTANLSIYRFNTNDNWMSITEVEVPF